MNRERSQVIVQRYFPSYDFGFSTELSSRECSERLDHFLSHQERPTGFVLTDPRVDGVVSGSTFRFCRRQAAMGGSVRPAVDGYFVPEQEGTLVLARVEVPRFWWFFDAIMFIIVLVNLGLSWYSLAASAGLAVLLAFVSLAPTWVEGAQAASLLRRILSSRPSA